MTLDTTFYKDFKDEIERALLRLEVIYTKDNKGEIGNYQLIQLELESLITQNMTKKFHIDIQKTLEYLRDNPSTEEAIEKRRKLHDLFYGIHVMKFYLSNTMINLTYCVDTIKNIKELLDYIRKGFKEPKSCKI